MGRLITELEDLTYLSWGWDRSTPGTVGTYYKAYSTLEGTKKRYYKLSRFDSELGTTGHECVNELIADRLLTKLEVAHLSYDLVYADIKIDDQIFRTWLCVSEDFKQPGESKIAFEDFFKANSYPHESPVNFFVRLGWGEYLKQLIALDFLIINRDRHGANVEILRNQRQKTYRPAPLFDHGCSLIFSCQSEDEARAFDPKADIPAQSLIGGFGKTLLRNNLRHLQGVLPFKGRLQEHDRQELLEGLDGILGRAWLDKIRQIIWQRWCELEDICNKG